MSQQLVATYSPEDNKLRLYASERLEKELYDKVRENDFRYAPKQKLFVAPKWTPSRRDFLLSLCGDIQDEQTSAEERAEQRAERFGIYQDKRKSDAESAYNESQELAAAVPMGQPILVGHHSQRKAEKQAQRIESTMQKAVTMWDRSEYWEQRARGVLSNVKYKESTDVRLRRIKKIEANKRRQLKDIKSAETFLGYWENPEKELTLKRAMAIANHDYLASWSDLESGKQTPEEVKAKAVKAHHRNINFLNQWVNHNDLRINYENSILKAQGYEAPEPTKRPKLPPIINCDGEGFHHMTKEQYKKIASDYKWCKTFENDGNKYRVRVVQNFRLELKDKSDSWGNTKIFITDQKKIDLPTSKAA